MQPVFRFAPSPNGPLHLGHAYSALLNAHLARVSGGRFLVRIEDIDTVRCRPHWIAAACADLDWLGLVYEHPVLQQSTRFAAYRTASARLEAQGVLYPCFCTRAQLARDTQDTTPETLRDPDGTALYPGTCRQLDPQVARARMAAGEPYALRLNMRAALARMRVPLWIHTFCVPPAPFLERAQRDAFAAVQDPQSGPEAPCVFPAAPAPILATPEIWGDVVLVRKEYPTSYALAVVVDDAFQGVTHVVRGADLEQATHLHALLQALLGLPRPLYHHHALLREDTGEKLAKSKGTSGFTALGLSAAQLRAQLGFAG